MHNAQGAYYVTCQSGNIILDLDDTVEINHISNQLECSSSPRKPKHTQPRGRVNTELISSHREKLIAIQFGSLEPVVVPIESKGPLTKIDPFMDVSDKADVDEEGWTLVTHRRPRK